LLQRSVVDRLLSAFGLGELTPSRVP